MVIFSAIIGVLMMIGGIFCIFSPIITLFSTGYFIGILFFIFGLVGILRAVSTKTVTALGMITDALALFVGICAIVRPGTTRVIDRFLIYLVAFWFLIQGICSIIVAIQKKAEVKGWYWGLIAGILGCIVGFFFLLHPVLTAIATGVLIGISFLQAGIQTLTFALFHKSDSTE
ncbi:MAG: HdeD family acid-resistance protein [Bilifractor sp.]